MRILLATAVALAPLTIAAGAQAQVVISNARTTPISTSNATGSAADSIRIAGGGSVTVSSGTAVTIDSSHNVTVDGGGSITMDNAANSSIALLVNGGNTADVTIAGQISVRDSITEYSDTDGDGDLDGPYATGTDRYGIRIAGASPLIGDVLLQASGSVLVEGNDSYGISNEAGIVGDLQSLGSIRVTGDNSVAISSTGAVTGDVVAAGTINVLGGNASGVVIEGDIGGRLTLQSNMNVTGYRYTQRGTQEFIDGLEPEDILQSGSAVVIAGSVGGGVVFDIPPEESDEDETDEDGDGRPDASEGLSNIQVFGGSPAVVVGSAERATTLGVVGTDAEAFGFINRGEIGANGVYDDVASTTVQFGVPGGQTVSVEGGILNSGSIVASASEASATGIRFAAGLTTPRLHNDGTISVASATSGRDLVSGVLIEAGANVPDFNNGGGIIVSGFGGTADVAAIRDLSGSLSLITNTGAIQGLLEPNADGDALTGRAAAIDVRANTAGVTLIQDGVLTPDPGEGELPIVDADGDGVADADEPIIRGDILLGSGEDVVDVRNGVVIGDISFGNGADSLTISGGAIISGALSDSDGLLSVDVQNGTLDARQSGQVNTTLLNVGSDGNLVVTVDPTADAPSGFRVNGTANIANGAGLGIRFTSLIQDAQRFTVIDADTLNYGTVDSASVQENSPYLFVVSAGADVAAGDVFIDARRRTADEADLIAVERQAFDSFYAALDDSDVLLNAFLSQTDREGFINLYEQMLPDHSGGPLLSLASGVDAVTRALTGRNASAGVGETSAWVQEINFYADKDKTDTYGFRSEGFGIAGGVERGTGFGALGVSLAFTSADLEDPEAEAEEVLSASLVELGLYWRAQGQNWTTWARAAAGYASFDATRALVDEGLNLSNESQWHGFTLAAAAGASYERNYGRLNIRPEAYVEYFGLSEESRSEQGGGDGFDLEIDERDGHLFSAVAAVNVGYGFGANGWLRPELRLGWRQNISVDPGETIARFASGGPDFRLTPDTIEGGGPIAGLRLGVGNELGMLSIAADAEMIEDYVRYTLLLRASFRF